MDTQSDSELAALPARELELARLREAIAPALERARRGEGRPPDADRMKDEVTRRLAELGIADA